MRTVETKYVVEPGRVRSWNDNDVHYINSEELMRLYGVDPDECIIRYHDERDHGVDFSGLIRLYPRADGKYKVPR